MNTPLTRIDPAQVDATVRAALDPLKEQVVQIDEQIAVREKELGDLRDVRRRVQRVMDAIEPRKTKPKAVRTHAASVQLRDDLVDWIKKALKEGQLEDAFTVRDVEGIDPMGLSNSSYQRIIRELADQGVLRLDSIGPRNGREAGPRSNFYKLSAPA